MELSCSAEKKKKFSKQILKWYSSNKSSYPWRIKPSPYRILITEMLLRKTTRNQVAGLFTKFFRNFPTLNKLASARRKEIEKVIMPLGMEKVRSRLLQDISRVIIEDYKGKIPKTKGELLELPGIGDYTANAVLLFTNREKVALVDTNAKRIVERVFASNRNSELRVGESLRSFVTCLLPQKKYLEFNLAILDFANSVCLPRNPKCKSCPVKSLCNYYQSYGYT